MKTIKIIAIFTILIAISITSYSNEKSIDKKDNLYQKISKEITYPSSAIEMQKQGVVFVEFLIDNDGKIKIEQMNYEDVTLGDYVREKLTSIIVDTNNNNIDKLHAMKFEFKLL